MAWCGEPASLIPCRTTDYFDDYSVFQSMLQRTSILGRVCPSVYPVSWLNREKLFLKVKSLSMT